MLDTEDMIIDALKKFGPMTADQIQARLRAMVGIVTIISHLKDLYRAKTVGIDGSCSPPVYVLRATPTERTE